MTREVWCQPPVRTRSPTNYWVQSMTIRKNISVAICLLVFSTLNAGASEVVTTILVNVHIITVDDQFSLQQAVALAGKRIGSAKASII